MIAAIVRLIGLVLAFPCRRIPFWKPACGFPPVHRFPGAGAAFDLTDLRAPPLAVTTDRSAHFHPAPGLLGGSPAGWAGQGLIRSLAYTGGNFEKAPNAIVR